MRRLAIDIGGTFTDVVLEAEGRRFSTKVLTTPKAPEEGFLEGTMAVLKKSGLAPGQIEAVIHGTTLATNAIIERRGARVGLITTAGFRDCLEIAYEHRFEQTDLNMIRPPPLVPRTLRLELPERMAADGTIVTPLDEAAVLKVADQLRGAQVEAVAVGLLHSYANDTHERRIRELITASLPGIPISLSSQVSPEIREYDRISTTVANAYVRPQMEGYLTRLKRILAERGFTCGLLMITSSGAMTTLETACEFPIRLVESGPAGGAVLASNLSVELDATRVVSFDMGGTTAKICLIDNFRPLHARTFEVARAYRFLKGSGYPLRIPVIEMVEIGAGGGSIAAVDDLSRVTVGPQSASSVPGPACYGLGGTKPTVTDADLTLGRLEPNFFAGGKIKLDAPAAQGALNEAVGQPLNLTPQQAAAGVAEIVDENMANAARVHAIEWGKELADRTMIAFGGAAPLHAARLAEKCGIRRVVIPTGAGVGSAIGFLQAPVGYDVTRSRYLQLSAFSAEFVNSLFAEMSAEATASIRLASPSGLIEERRTAYMRYRGQGHEIDVELPTRALTATDGALLEKLFLERYTELFGRTIPNLGTEVMTWSLSAAIAVMRPSKLPPTPSAKPYVGDTRRAIFDTELLRPIDYQIVRRDQLVPGVVVRGPAIIVEEETSTLVSRHFDATILSSGYIELTRNDHA